MKTSLTVDGVLQVEDGNPVVTGTPHSYKTTYESGLFTYVAFEDKDPMKYDHD